MVEDLGAGNHVVRVSSPDYVTKTETFFLKPGETFPLELTLTGAVSAVPEPLGIRVNVQAGTRPDATLREIEAADSAQKAQLIQQMIDGSSGRYGLASRWRCCCRWTGGWKSASPATRCSPWRARFCCWGTFG